MSFTPAAEPTQHRYKSGEIPKVGDMVEYESKTFDPSLRQQPRKMTGFVFGWEDGVAAVAKFELTVRYTLESKTPLPSPCVTREEVPIKDLVWKDSPVIPWSENLVPG